MPTTTGTYAPCVDDKCMNYVYTADEIEDKITAINSNISDVEELVGTALSEANKANNTALDATQKLTNNKSRYNSCVTDLSADISLLTSQTTVAGVKEAAAAALTDIKNMLSSLS